MRIQPFRSGTRIWEFGGGKVGMALRVGKVGGAVWGGNVGRAIWVGHIQGPDAALHAVRPKRYTQSDQSSSSS